MTSLRWDVWDQVPVCRDGVRPAGGQGRGRVCRDAEQAWDLRDGDLPVSDRRDAELRVWEPDDRGEVHRVSGRVFPAWVQVWDRVCRVWGPDEGRRGGDCRDEVRACAGAYPVRDRDEAEQPQHCRAAERPSYRRSAYSPENKERYVYP